MSTAVDTPAAANPHSPKLIAALIGGGGAVILAQVLTWLVGAIISGDWSAADVDVAYASVPGPLIVLINTALTLVGIYFPGYNAVDPLRQAGLAAQQGTVGPAQVVTPPTVAVPASDTAIPGPITATPPTE